MASQYEHLLEDLGTNKPFGTIQTWTLTETLAGLLIVLAAYLALVVKLLPDIMKNRPAYKLNNLLLFYNAFQVVFSAYLVFIYMRYILRYNVITTRCPKDQDLQEVCMSLDLLRNNLWNWIIHRDFVLGILGTLSKVINEIYPYFIAKHLDLLDTVFFVFRKKDNQITFLHLYHHTTMVGWTWFHLMYYPTDHFVVVGMLNSFVHVLMYAYYGISALGPQYAKYIWWKKHLTKVQLVQFILVVSHLYYQQKLTPCPLPTAFHYYCMTLIYSFFALFMNFYIRSYQKRHKKNAENSY